MSKTLTVTVKEPVVKSTNLNVNLSNRELAVFVISNISVDSRFQRVFSTMSAFNDATRPFWSNGPTPGAFYDFPGSAAYHNNVVSANQGDYGSQRAR